MSHPSAASGVFGQPFAQQVAFFRRKLGKLVPTRRWDDLEGAAHDDAFMVAGATKADLLTDLAAAADKAIAEGRGLDEFRRDFRAIVAQNGWTGWTGEGSVKGEAWRVGTILRTNAYTSYAAGRFSQLQAGKFAYWVYRHGNSQEPRPEHLDWNGLTLPPGHPFWTRHYPPSDWGCSCYVVGASSLAMARRLGGEPSKKLPANWNRIDPKTGAPVGIGKGWDYAPGASVSHLVQAMAAKVGNWDYMIAKSFLEELPADQVNALSAAYRALPSTAADARRYAQSVIETGEPVDGRPVRTFGQIGTAEAARVRAIAGIDVERMDLRMTPDAVRHVIEQHGQPAAELSRGQKPVTADDFAMLPMIVGSPDDIAGPDRSDINELLVHFVKTIDGRRYTATFAINRRRGSLSLKTMFVKQGDASLR